MKTSTKYIIGALSLAAIGGGVLLYINRRKISKVARNAVDLAKGEFDYWNEGSNQRKENEASVFDRLKDYWQEGADIFWSKTKMVNEAWSAAFISYLMKKAGAGDDFKYSASHSVYIRDAIKNRKEDNKNPFKGYKPEEVKVEKGDLVCYARQGGVGYDTTGAYKSHCDMVIDVAKDKATTIGGNVSNSVSKTEVDLDDNKQIVDPKYFVVIKNKKR